MKRLFIAAFAVLPLLASAQELKIGYVEAESIMMAMPELTEVEKQMADYNAQNAKYLQDMEAEIQAEQSKYEAMTSATAAMKADQETKIQTLYQRYQTTVRTIQQDAQAKQASLLKPLQDKLLKTIESVGAKNNFYIVLDKNTILYKSSKAIDITPLVKKELGLK